MPIFFLGSPLVVAIDININDISSISEVKMVSHHICQFHRVCNVEMNTLWLCIDSLISELLQYLGELTVASIWLHVRLSLLARLAYFLCMVCIQRMIELQHVPLRINVRNCLPKPCLYHLPILRQLISLS
jgi:hypothetical protein